MSRWMKCFLIASVVLTAVAGAKEKSVTGPWTLMVEERFGLKLVLEQKNKNVTGTLDWPHGDPVKLTGKMAGDTLTFSGDSEGENFTVHVDSTGTLKADGTMAGVLKARFIETNDEKKVVRTRNQEIPWTARRGLEGVMHFPR